MPSELFMNSQVASKRLIYTPSPFARTSLLHLQECGQLTAIKPHTGSRSNLASYLFFLVEKGSGTLSYEGQHYDLKTNDCVFIDCRNSYSQSSGEDLWTLAWTHFNGPNLPAIYRKFRERGGYNVFQPQNPDAYRNLLEEIYALAGSDTYTRDMQINRKLTELVTMLMEESWHPEARRSNASRKVNMLEVKDYVDLHFTQPAMTLERLANHFFVNKNYLARCFKAQFGTTLGNYIQQVRITKAKELLRFTDESIEEVSAACGYEDPNYFSRVFRKIEGSAPGQYRKSWRGTHFE